MGAEEESARINRSMEHPSNHIGPGSRDDRERRLLSASETRSEPRPRRPRAPPGPLPGSPAPRAARGRPARPGTAPGSDRPPCSAATTAAPAPPRRCLRGRSWARRAGTGELHRSSSRPRSTGRNGLGVSAAPARAASTSATASACWAAMPPCLIGNETASPAAYTARRPRTAPCSVAGMKPSASLGSPGRRGPTSRGIDTTRSAGREIPPVALSSPCANSIGCAPGTTAMPRRSSRSPTASLAARPNRASGARSGVSRVSSTPARVRGRPGERRSGAQARTAAEPRPYRSGPRRRRAVSVRRRARRAVPGARPDSAVPWNTSAPGSGSPGCPPQATTSASYSMTAPAGGRHPPPAGVDRRQRIQAVTRPDRGRAAPTGEPGTRRRLRMARSPRAACTLNSPSGESTSISTRSSASARRASTHSRPATPAPATSTR